MNKLIKITHQFTNESISKYIYFQYISSFLITLSKFQILEN